MQKYSFHLICHHPNENLFFNTFAVEVRFTIYKVRFTIGQNMLEKHNYKTYYKS